MLVSAKVKSSRAGGDKWGKRIVRLLFGGLLASLCVWLFLLLGGYVLRRLAVAQIVDLTGAKVSTASVNVNLKGWVFIRGLSLDRHQQGANSNTILEAERVDARFDLSSLLLLHPRVEEIHVHNFVFDALYDIDSARWNVSDLNMAVPGMGAAVPAVCLEGGTLRYGKVSAGQVQIVAAVPVEARFAPSTEAEDGYSFSISTAERPYYGRSTLKGLWRPGRVTTTGSISSVDVAAFERVWTVRVLAAQLVYDDDNNYSLKLRIKDLLSAHRPGWGTFALDSRDLLGNTSPFTSLQGFFDRYRPAGGADLDLNVEGNLNDVGSSAYEGVVFCKDICVCDRKFAYALDNIVGRVGFNNQGIELKELVGRHGGVEVTINGWSRGFGARKSCDIEITSENMALDEDLYEALDEEQRKFWSAFSPAGTAATKYRIVKTPGKSEEKTLAIELRGAEAVYRGFPYPLKNLRGRLFFEQDGITASGIVSEFGDCKIAIDGKLIRGSGAHPWYEFVINGRDIPLDATLAKALPDRQKRFFEQLEMKGFADAKITVSPRQNRFEEADFVAHVLFKRASLGFDVIRNCFTSEAERAGEFVLPISDVNAKAVITPKLIGIEELQGRYGDSPVSVRGRVWPGEETSDVRYCFLLGAERLKLSDELTCVLPSAAQEIFSKLKPDGRINLRANLNRDGRDCPEFKVVLDCLGNSIQVPLKAEGVTYPLRDVTGNITITQDIIQLNQLSAVPAGPDAPAEDGSLTIDGRIMLSGGTFSVASLRLKGGDIGLDDRLGEALPDCIRPLYVKLQPGGRIDLDLQSLEIRSAEGHQREVDFEGSAELKSCNLKVRPKVTEFNAVLEMKGSYSTGAGIKSGRVVISTGEGRIKGKSLKGLKADIGYDLNRQSWVSRELIADFYGGHLTGRFELKQATGLALEYLLEVGFGDVDLRKLLADGQKPEQFYTSGKLGGLLCVTGKTIPQGGAADSGANGSSENGSRIGRCRLTITDMQVGKLSPLSKLLHVLSLTEPQDFAFEKLVVDSYIRGEAVILENMDLSGETVAFNGSGRVDLAEESVSLVLYARGQRVALSQPSVLQSLTESLGSAMVRLEVTGSLYDPIVVTKPLPVIDDTLGIFGANR